MQAMIFTALERKGDAGGEKRGRYPYSSRTLQMS